MSDDEIESLSKVMTDKEFEEYMKPCWELSRTIDKVLRLNRT